MKGIQCFSTNFSNEKCQEVGLVFVNIVNKSFQVFLTFPIPHKILKKIIEMKIQLF